MASLAEIGKHFGVWFANQPIGRRVTTIVVLVGFLGVFLAFVARYKEGAMELLYGNLNDEDVGGIVERLKVQNIKYEVREGGAIYVPRGMKYDLRASLASEGLTFAGAGPGLEIFDKTQLGMTDYVQKVNFQRALKGELTRTINSLSCVKSSRVTIQAPEPSPFLKEETKPAACVVVELRHAQRLTNLQIRGIRNIVATAAPGLTPDDVQVINNQGELLSGADTPELASATSQQIQHQRNYETMLRSNVESMIERWVGRGHVVAAVNAQFDFSQEESVKETYEDDNKTITMEHTTTHRLAATSPNPQGVAGSESNMPDVEGKTAPASLTVSQGGGVQEDRTVNYQAGKTQITKKMPVGKLTRLQVAVQVDERYNQTPPAEGKAGDKTATKSAVDIENDRKKIASLVKSAVGYDEERNDQVSVEFVPFDTTQMPAPEVESPLLQWEERLRYWTQYLLHYGFPALIVLLFLFGAVRPFIRYLDRQQAEVRKAQARLQTAAQLEAAFEQGKALPQDLLDGGGAELLRRREVNTLNEQVNKMVQADPAKSAKTIRSWLES